VARNRKKTRNQDSRLSSDDQPPPKSPANRIERIAGLLSELAYLMRQEDLGRESLHHLRQLQMRIRFAQGKSSTEAQEAPSIQKSPGLWSERKNRDETPLDFIRREYGALLGRGLSRADLRADASLYQALKRWLSKNEMPADVDLPGKRELTDRELASGRALSIVHSPEQRERLRLKQAARRRAQKVPKKD
jgi:hypothetical protein